MEIIIFGILIGIMLICIAMNRFYALLGMVGGIGLIMLALTIPISGLQAITGLNQISVYDAGLNQTTTNITYVFTPISNVFGGISFIDTLLTLVIGGIGLLVIIQSVMANKAVNE